jgi:hypothetical protein
MLTKLAWTLWGLLPVAGLAYHYGPGQRAYTEDKAADVLAEAQALEARAEALQSAAHQTHLAWIDARKAAVASKVADDEQAARGAAVAQDEAYGAAAAAWQETADKLQSAQDMLAACGSDKTQGVRVARNRALIRAGRIAAGVGDLENLLDTLRENGEVDSPLARLTREEIATGYYYGARLMRMAGKPTQEWREVSGWSRQNFRYLAETGADANAVKADDFQKNLELVLNLEQSAQEDLLAKPLPKNCPRAGNCEGLSNCKGKTKRPPRDRKDARGAGGVGEIEGGW